MKLWIDGSYNVLSSLLKTPLPEKQGLKLANQYSNNTQGHQLKTPLPEKQGLKRLKSNLVIVFCILKTPLPEKQGLKRFKSG